MTAILVFDLCNYNHQETLKGEGTLPGKLDVLLQALLHHLLEQLEPVNPSFALLGHLPPGSRPRLLGTNIACRLLGLLLLRLLVWDMLASRSLLCFHFALLHFLFTLHKSRQMFQIYGEQEGTKRTPIRRMRGGASLATTLNPAVTPPQSRARQSSPPEWV